MLLWKSLAFFIMKGKSINCRTFLFAHLNEDTPFKALFLRFNPDHNLRKKLPFKGKEVKTTPSWENRYGKKRKKVKEFPLVLLSCLKKEFEKVL